MQEIKSHNQKRFKWAMNKSVLKAFEILKFFYKEGQVKKENMLLVHSYDDDDKNIYPDLEYMLEIYKDAYWKKNNLEKYWKKKEEHMI